MEEKFLLEIDGEARNRRVVGFIKGDGKILNSLYIVGKRVLTPYKDLPILPIPPYSNVVHPLPLTSLSPPTPTSTVLSAVMFL